MAQWEFSDYVTEQQAIPAREWYASLPVPAQAAFDFAVGVLRATADWRVDAAEYFKELTAQHAGLSEVRFYFDQANPGKKPTRRRFRAIGVWSETDRTFVFFGGCEKIAMNTVPANAFNDAMTTLAAYNSGLGETVEHF